MALEDHNGKLRNAATRLEQISAELDRAETGDEVAVALAREAAEIAGEVGAIAADAARAASESSD